MVTANPPASTMGPWQFRPTGLTTPERYAWNGSQAYHDFDLWGANDTGNPTAIAAENLWSGQYTPNAGSPERFSNPPFLSMAAGQLMPDLVGTGGHPARLLRGFIRRSYIVQNDPNSSTRLNFMFNPPQIQRDYVSYLDQGALDPFNTAFNSGNLVAPPSILNFSFELFFDRQDEARDPDNPGVFVDQEYFDRVVRGVLPTAVGPHPSTMPDNGLLLVGAQDITVVFSPNLSVTGRPINASISYLKFTHRMVPTRMVISLQLRAVAIGPASPTIAMQEVESFAAAARVVPAAVEEVVPSFTFAETKWGSTDEELNTLVLAQQGFASAASTSASGAGDGSAVDYAKAQVAKFNTQYTATNRMDLWHHADCSSLVWGGHVGAGTNEQLGWSKTDAPSSYYMWDGLRKSAKAEKIWGFSGTPGRTEGLRKMQKGDLLFRIVGDGSVTGENHVSFVDSVNGDTIVTFAAKGSKAQPNCGFTTFTVNNVPSNYNYGMRPLVRGSSVAANVANEPVTPRARTHVSSSDYHGLF